MARVETKVFQCHPKDEQSQVQLMNAFFWKMINTQEINVVSSSLGVRGENLFLENKTHRYVKLAFERQTDIPHYKAIKKLEEEYERLPIPKFPKLFPGGWILWVCLMFFTLLWAAVPWLVYYIFVYRLKLPRAKRQYEQHEISRKEIMERLDYLENLPEESEPVQQEIKPQLAIS